MARLSADLQPSFVFCCFIWVTRKVLYLFFKHKSLLLQYYVLGIVISVVGFGVVLSVVESMQAILVGLASIDTFFMFLLICMTTGLGQH